MEVGADVGEPAGLLVVRVHEDHGDAGRQGRLRLFDEGADLRAGCGDAVGARGDGGVEVLLLHRDVVRGERDVDLDAEILAGLHRSVVHEDPVRDPTGVPWVTM